MASCEGRLEAQAMGEGAGGERGARNGRILKDLAAVRDGERTLRIQ